MDIILPIIAFIFVLVWASRVEIGISKANQALKRIEQQLSDKKEKK